MIYIAEFSITFIRTITSHVWESVSFYVVTVCCWCRHVYAVNACHVAIH